MVHQSTWFCESLQDPLYLVCILTFSPNQSGLTQACINSPHTLDFVSKEVVSYIKKWIPQQRAGVLAGNSIHADRGFLVEEMPEVTDWLHYRSLDCCSNVMK